MKQLGYTFWMGAAAAAAVAVVAGTAMMQQSPAPENSYIVQAGSLDAARDAVRTVDGDITHELGIIRAVAADLTTAEVDTLRRHSAVTRVYENGDVETTGKKNNGKGGTTSHTGNYTTVDTHIARLVNADALHAMGITGEGVGIAVLDTGLWKHDGIRYDTAGNTRLNAAYDAINDVVPDNPLNGDDDAGHGSHVASVAASSLKTSDGYYNGIAPGAHLISVRAFDENGNGTYADVVRAIQWIVTNRKKHKVHIINASFSAVPKSNYWEDPINQALMVAHQDNLLVVAAAGNRGPGPMTIGVPGNLPYALTVGAMTDNYTPADASDDELASFSSTGPTIEGFVKPEVVAPGGHTLGLVQGTSTLARLYPEYYESDMYFQMSGTSQAAAVVSGIAALTLQAEAWHGPDALKCKIMSAARPAVTGTGDNAALAYSVFQQGAGLVDAYAAAFNNRTDCANIGLHVDNDLDGFQHFGGPANKLADGSFYLRGNLSSDEGGYSWDGTYTDASGYLWTQGYLWSDEYVWTNGYLWTDGVGVDGYLWTDGDVWTQGYLWTDEEVGIDGYLWTDTEMASMSTWVPQE